MYHQEQKLTIQQTTKVTTLPQQSMKRKSGPAQLLSDRKTKLSQQEESDLSERESVTSTPSSSFIANEEQEKMMVLSAEARQALIQMQRFDRFIYVMESEKRLKGPIEKELKRLEKIKNSGNKTMKSSYFDNELTITCLFNHMKNMYEMNRDLGEIVVLKAEIQALQQKIIDQNVKYNKDVKEASTAAKGKFAEDSQQLKETIKFHENIISALKESNLDRSKKKVEAEIKRYTEDKKVLLELISDLISRASAETSGSIIDTFTITIDKITQDQGDINKNLTYLEKERKVVEKAMNDPRTDEGKRKALEQLLDTIHYIISIYGLAKSSEGGSKVGTKVPQSPREEGPGGDKKVLKQLEERLRAFQQEGNHWVLEFETLTTRLEGDENITTDINKHRKLLGVKKNMDPTISRFTQLILNILEIFNRKVREQNQSSNADKERASQIERLTKTNTALEKQIQQLRDEVGKSKAQKQPSAEAEWTKLVNMVNEAFRKRDEKEPTAQGEINKTKKFLDLNRKKFPAQDQSLLDTIDYLIRLIVESDGAIKQIDLQNSRRQQAEGKDIANFQALSAALEKLLVSGDTFNDGYLNKLRKNLEMTFGKLQKLEESPLLNLYLGSLDNTWKIIEMLERVHQSSKGKGDTEIKKQDYEILQNQLKAKQLDLKSKDQQLKSSRHQYSTLQRKIQEYERRLADMQKQGGSKKGEVEDQRKEKLRGNELQKQVKGLEREIERLGKEMERLGRENERLGKDKLSVVELEKEVKRLTNELQSSSSIKELERENNELKRSVENLNRSVNDGKAKEVERLKREVEQLKSIQTAQQESISLKNEEIESFKRRVRDFEKNRTEVKYIETRVESREGGEGAEYWRERYQASKMENEVLREELASLERRYDEVYIGSTQLLNPQSFVKAQQTDLDLNRVKASLAKQEAVSLSQSLEIERYRQQESEYKNNIQSLNQQLRNSQMAAATSSKSISIERQVGDLIAENTKLQDEIISVKGQLNSTIDNLIFVDGENFKLTQMSNRAEERCKVLENQVSVLEKSMKSGLQVSKLRDQKMDLENKYEELRREMDILVSELQSQKRGKTNRTSTSVRIPGTPVNDKVISTQWTTSSQHRESGLSYTKSQSSLNYPDNNKQLQAMAERITRLESEKKAMGERLGLLQIYSSSMTGVNETFIDNVNKMIENIIRFMIDFEGISEHILIESTLLAEIQKCLKQQDYVRYFQLSEEYLRNAVTTLLMSKNNILTAGIESREIIIQSSTTRVESLAFKQ